MKGFKQLGEEARSVPMSEITQGKLNLSTIKYEGSNMILARIQRITKLKTVAKRVLLMLTSSAFKFCHATSTLCILTTFYIFQ